MNVTLTSSEVVTFISGVGLLIVSGGVTWLFATRAKAVKARELLQERVTELEANLQLVQAAVVPISTAFQAILIKELTHYHTPVMDALMVKLGPPNTLTEAEEIQLAKALEERTVTLNGLISDSERDAAMMLPLIMKRVRAEVTDSITTVQVVGLPAESTKEK